MADTVFWSWQSDSDAKTNRHFIRDALTKAVDRVSQDLGVEDADRVELDHDTKSASGMADISNTILEQVSAAAVFVADVTPIASANTGKKLPNPNVMVELGYALHALGFKRIIAILNTGEGHKTEELPFDIRHRRILTYCLSAAVGKSERKRVGDKLAKELTVAIKGNIENAMEARSAEQPILGAAESETFPGLWDAEWPAAVQCSFGSQRTIQPVEHARAYLRVIPESYPKGMPQITALGNLPQSATLWAPQGGGLSGNYGTCEFGYISYWIRNELSEGADLACNIAGFLEDTGEIWLSDATVLTEGQSKISHAHLLTNWASGLDSANRVLDELGASKRRRVIVGISNLQDVVWPAQAGYVAPQSRKPKFETETTAHLWEKEQQITFLHSAWNGLRNAFSLEAMNAKDFRQYYTLRKRQ